MVARFVCLANSLKEGGRCVAGIELEQNNARKIVNGVPKWIRPVCKTNHGEIPKRLTEHIQLLDIIELDIIGIPFEKSYQSENVFFREKSLRIVGKFPVKELDQLCDRRQFIFESRSKAISRDAIQSIDYSLVLVKPNQFEAKIKEYEDNPFKAPQVRMIFTYHGILYDFPVTDPVFITKIQSNPEFLKNQQDLYFCLSLGINWNDWHYKLVAGVII